LHFVVLGAALFASYRALSPATAEPTRIVVTAGQVEALEAQFRTTKQRAPDDAERRALLDRFVRDEVLYREGLARGLDRDDPIIRNRVKLRMEFLAEDMTSKEPTDAELADYLAAHHAEFEIPGKITFEQLYFDPSRRGPNLEHDIEAARKAVAQGRRTEGIGDRTMLPPRMSGASPAEVASTFGDELGAALAAQPVGEWRGPVRSTFGMHLVRVVSQGEPQVPTLADSRDVVAREWARERSATMKEKYYRELRARYSVTVEPTTRTAEAGNP
jgi:hypothetical protein